MNTRSYLPDEVFNLTRDSNIKFPLNFPGANERCLVTANNGSQILSFAGDDSSLVLDNLLLLKLPMSVGQYFHLDTISNDSIPAECPSIAILFGGFKWNSTAPLNLTALVCSQGIEQVPVTVDYSINSTFQGTTKIHVWGQPRSILDATDRSQTLAYKLHGFMQAILLPFPENTDYESWYDAFFNHLLFRPGGSKFEDLLGPGNVDRYIKAVTADYEECVRNPIDRKFGAANQTSVSDIFSAVENNSKEPWASN